MTSDGRFPAPSPRAPCSARPFHLYQGIGGFVFNIVGGVIAALVFRRTKRVMPLVIAHVLIDLIAFGFSLFFPDLAARLR